MAPKNQKNIRCLSVNICGIGGKSKIPLDKYVDIKAPDILKVQETLTSDMEKLSLTNMKVLGDDNHARNRGAALYVHKNFTITKLEEINEISKNIDSSWGLGVIHKQRYVLGSVYVKLGYNNAITDVINMLNKAHILMKKHKATAILLSGDFNARHIAWGDHFTNDYGTNLFDKIDKTKFSILTSSTPTFLSKNGSSYIDLMIVTTNMVDKVQFCKTDTEVQLFSGAPNMGHVPLITQFNSKGGVITTKPIEKINLDKVDWKKWSDDLDYEIAENEDLLKALTNPQELNDYLTRAIQKTTSKHGEKKIITTHSKPFWTPQLSELRDRMNEASKCYAKRNTDINEENLLLAKESFDEARKQECKNFILEKTNNLNNAQKLKFWKEFNKLFKKKVEQSIEPLVDPDGSILTNENEIEELMFTTFFEGKHLHGQEFDNYFYEEVNKLYEDILLLNPEDLNVYSLDLNAPITMEEIKSAIKNYGCAGKSNDKEEFNPKMFKHLGENFLKYLQIVANECLNQGKWIWNKAEIIFLRKNGKDSYAKPGAYRPISISSYIGKLVEKIIAKRIQRYLNIIGIYDPDQEGFMEGKNTIRYLNRLVTNIRSDIQKKLTSICLFIDFEKAFDSVWKRGLLIKLHNLGITGKMFHLIDSFLMSRKVALNINGTVGPDKKSSDVGVPQGSALSPILFRIYVMDLAEELANKENISLLKFADDGTIRVSGVTTEECLITLQFALDEINKWARKWRMVINCQPDKTEVICFSTAENDRKLIPNTFKLGESDIQLVHKTKVLGLILDDKLNFQDHSKFVYKKLCHIWVKVCEYSNRHWGFHVKTMLTILKTLFLPTLLYAGHIWMNEHNLKDINCLYYKMIKSTIGAVLNIKQTHAEIILGLPPLNIVTELNRVKHYLKINMTQLPQDRLRRVIKKELSHNVTNFTSNAIKQVFRFLKWKLLNYPEKIETEDVQIIENMDLKNFFEISTDSCKYSKSMMVKYSEYLWLKSTKNQLYNEGVNVIPEPKCRPVPIPQKFNREEEVMLLSLFYPNNILKSSLYKINSDKFPDPLCGCCEGEENSFHILFHCRFVEQSLREQALNLLKSTVGEAEAAQEDSIVLLKASKDEKFINSICEIVKTQMVHLNTKVYL